MAGKPDPLARGYRNLSETLEHLAQVSPHRIYASIPAGKDLTSGFHDITVQQMLGAIDACAWWISCTFGISPNFETLAYVGVADLRYAIFFYSAIKCGYKIFFASPRMPIDQYVALLQQLGCSKFVYSTEMKSKALELQSKMPVLSCNESLPQEQWFREPHKAYSYDKTFEECKWDPVVVLHSSGSTGPPKPIVLNHGYFAVIDRALPPIQGRQVPFHRVYDFENGGKFYSPSPAFHLSGILSTCVYPVFSECAAVVLGLPTQTPSAESITDIMDNVQGLKLLFSLPMYIEQIAQYSGGLERLARLGYVLFTGGPLSESCGNALASKTKLCSWYGSTEAGGGPLIFPEPENWDWMEFHDCYGAVMAPVLENLYELVLPEDRDAAFWRGNTWTYPEMKDWRTKDLFETHPMKPGLHRYYGRTDDIFVLSTGQQINPIPFENALLQHKSISAALMVGQDRPVAALLIEAAIKVDGMNSKHLEASIIKAIGEINASSEKVQVNLDKVLFFQPGTFVRASKGTVVRKLTYVKVQDLVERLYA